MKKFLSIMLIGIISLGVVACSPKKEDNNLTKNYKVADLIKLSNDVHANVENKPFVDAMEIDINNADLFKMTTGLKNNTNVEYVVRTEAMIGSQAYSFVLVKVNENANIETMKKEMIDNIDPAKWICVRADKVYVNNYGSVIMLVMGDTKIADVDAIYKEFEKISNNNLGKKLEKIGEES